MNRWRERGLARAKGSVVSRANDQPPSLCFPLRLPGRSTVASGIPAIALPATVDRRWDGRILEIIVNRVEKLGASLFAPTEWSERGVVRIACSEAKKKNSFPFFHATTSGEWVVTLRFFVPRNTFKPEALENALKLVPFHESPTPVLSDAPRVKIASHAGAIQEITITAHSAAELESPAFDAFLTKAVASVRVRNTSAKLKKASEL